MWHSFGTPRYLIRLLWYYSSDCHIQEGLGISLWDTRELSLRDHIWVLLQYAWFWLFYISFHHFCSRYSYSSHSRAYLWCATCFEGIISWLPWMSSLANCVQRRTLVSLLRDTFIMGWLSKHLMLGLCKRSEVLEYGDDICSTSLISL